MTSASFWQDAQSTPNATYQLEAEIVNPNATHQLEQKIGTVEIVFDQNKPSGGQDTETEASQPLSNSEMQALWLRRVQTKPADFAKSKFAYQLAAAEPDGNGE